MSLWWWANAITAPITTGWVSSLSSFVSFKSIESEYVLKRNYPWIIEFNRVKVINLQIIINDKRAHWKYPMPGVETEHQLHWI